MYNQHIKQKFSSFIKNANISNIIIVGSITLIGSCFGFFKEIIVAKNYGLSLLLDTYYIAILLPSFISNVFMSSYQSVFIPNYIAEKGEQKQIGSFQSTATIVTIAMSLFFLLISFLFTDYYLEYFFKGHEPEFYELIIEQFAYVAPCILFWGLTSIVNGLLNVDNEFKYSTLSAATTPICILICVIFLSDYFEELVLAIGTLIGSVLGFIFVLVVALNRRIIILSTPNFRSKNSLMMFKQLPAKTTASLLNGINPIVDQYFSAQLIVGSIAALNYGIKIPAFAIGIGAMALGNVLLPYFSKMAVFQKELLYTKLQKWLKYTFFLSLLVGIVGILLSFPIVKIVFERDAFVAEDTMIVSKIQQMYFIQIPFYLITIIMVRFLTSINKNNFMMFTSLISALLNLYLNYVLMKIFGVYGLALSTSIVALIISAVFYFYIKKLERNSNLQTNTNS
ncbi:murein biosynthesis integral membrane protein MurJ [Paucihalobacter sp.]|uniref:murein biosynthesis integral membrane protein MurJ n=1 Tax=Paucihalobacter sp. TaxID=2850405 RepID=UPI003D16217C